MITLMLGVVFFSVIHYNAKRQVNYCTISDKDINEWIFYVGGDVYCVGTDGQMMDQRELEVRSLWPVQDVYFVDERE
jgi:hypothetical protein